MPENTSIERKQLLRMWGAEIVSSPAAGGSNEAVRVAKLHRRGAPGLGDALPVRQPGQRPRALHTHRARDPRGPADHHALRRRPRHHGHAHGHRALPAREGARASRSSRPSRATASSSTACATSTRASSPSCTTPRVLTTRYSVGPRDAVRRTRELLEEEGIFAGISTGAILHAALGIAAKCVKAGAQRRHRVHRVRRRLEVPVDRRLRGHPRRRRGRPRRPALGLSPPIRDPARTQPVEPSRGSRPQRRWAPSACRIGIRPRAGAAPWSTAFGGRSGGAGLGQRRSR